VREGVLTNSAQQFEYFFFTAFPFDKESGVNDLRGQYRFG
jgi:hypothetical protein